MLAVLIGVVAVRAGTITIISSNSVTGQLLTNTYTVADSEIGIYPNGVGHTFGQANNHIGFYGTTPITQQTAAVTITNGVDLATLAAATSNTVYQLKKLGLLK